MSRISEMFAVFFILLGFANLSKGNIWCDRCECIGRLIRCRQIDVSVLLRRSESREVEMKAVWSLDFKHSFIPNVKFLLKTVPKIFPALKNLDLRGMGVCLTEIEQFVANVQDDCSTTTTSRPDVNVISVEEVYSQVEEVYSQVETTSSPGQETSTTTSQPPTPWKRVKDGSGIVKLLPKIRTVPPLVTSTTTSPSTSTTTTSPTPPTSSPRVRAGPLTDVIRTVLPKFGFDQTTTVYAPSSPTTSPPPTPQTGLIVSQSHLSVWEIAVITSSLLLVVIAFVAILFYLCGCCCSQCCGQQYSSRCREPRDRDRDPRDGSPPPEQFPLTQTSTSNLPIPRQVLSGSLESLGSIDLFDQRQELLRRRGKMD